MRKVARWLLSRFGYGIHKINPSGIYPNLSKDENIYYCETPIGNYNLPVQFQTDGVATTISQGKFFEPEIIETARKYIKPNTTVLDLGANFGQMSVEFSKAVGPLGLVYSFEAQSAVFDFLSKNIIANKCTNVKLINKAVSDKDEETVYFAPPDFSQESLFKGAPFSGNAVIADRENGIPVKTITIDSLNIETPISFIKIDVQGADLFAMQGAEQTIMKHKPVIIFEFEQPVQKYFKTNFNEYVQFVHKINYKFVEIVLGQNYLIAPND